jgi:hypothetical protein
MTDAELKYKLDLVRVARTETAERMEDNALHKMFGEINKSLTLQRSMWERLYAEVERDRMDRRREREAQREDDIRWRAEERAAREAHQKEVNNRLDTLEDEVSSSSGFRHGIFAAIGIIGTIFGLVSAYLAFVK